MSDFQTRLARLQSAYDELVTRKNEIDLRWSSGIFERYKNPVATAAHAPIFWRYDLDPQTNPLLLERIGVNGAYNTGAMYWNGWCASTSLTSLNQGYQPAACKCLVSSHEMFLSTKPLKRRTVPALIFSG